MVNSLENSKTADHMIVINEDDVVKCLGTIKTGKAAGPDKINGTVLKLCKYPMASILCKIFQLSVDRGIIPTMWKTSEIVPLPKKASPVCNNDYRPVALTSIIMKCLEKLIKNLLVEQVKSFTDPYQFAYAKCRCVDDATLSLTDFVLKHVDKPNSTSKKYYAKILFVDFSSAFNTIQPHLMMSKLNAMNVNPFLILWVNEFLTSRTQYVKYLGATSDTITTNTGAPQGCVLSPILFTLYTSDCISESVSTQLFKYADDTALVGLCVNDDKDYRCEVGKFVMWCESN